MDCTQEQKSGCDMEEVIEKVKGRMKPLNECNSTQYSDSVQRYFQYYGLDVGDDRAEHLFGTFKSDGRELAGHIYKPAEYKATVILLHGYLNHTGQMKHLIGYLLGQGHAVAAFDMPGHGISKGKRGSIDDFSQYSDALRDFTKVVSGRLHGPYHLIAFSLGSGVALDHLLTSEETIFDRVVLAAPLVRNVGWGSLKTGYKLYSKFGQSIPRAQRKNSSDEEFLEFNRTKDILHVQEVPLGWVKALYEWNDKIVNLPRRDRAVLVIQGTNDTTVDWRYNIKFIPSKLSNVKVSLIEKGRHELFNESLNIRSNVFLQIGDYLAEQPEPQRNVL
jgi:alpha-beta hydrolase superfamily lysophospholipase